MRPLSDLDRRRVRTSLKAVGLGILGGLVLALVTGLAGGSGRFGAVVVLLVGALSAALAALHAVVVLVLDDLRREAPSVRRAVLVVGLFLVAALLLSMALGLGG